MPSRIDNSHFILRTIGKLKILDFFYIKGPTRSIPYFKCECACGVIKNVRCTNILKHKAPTRSCGCSSPIFKKTHGFAYDPLYAKWKSIMHRCYYPSQISFPRYGGRGITVSKEWHNVEAFREDMSPYQPGMTIDRVKSSLCYSKENRSWPYTYT